MSPIDRESSQNAERRDIANVSEREKRDTFAEYIRNNKEIYLPFGEIRKDKKFMDFVSRNVGVWFFDLGRLMITERDGGGEPKYREIIYYIDKGLNLARLKLDYKKLSMIEDSLKPELAALGFIDAEEILPDDEPERGKLVSVIANLIHEGLEYQRELALALGHKKRSSFDF
jgi:hypothetical protein